MKYNLHQENNKTMQTDQSRDGRPKPRHSDSNLTCPNSFNPNGAFNTTIKLKMFTPNRLLPFLFLSLKPKIRPSHPRNVSLITFLPFSRLTWPFTQEQTKNVMNIQKNLENPARSSSNPEITTYRRSPPHRPKFQNNYKFHILIRLNFINTFTNPGLPRTSKIFTNLKMTKTLNCLHS